MNKSSIDLITLVNASINDKTPDIKDMDIHGLYELSKVEKLSSLVSLSVNKVLSDSPFKLSLSKNLKRTILFDKEREKLFKYMDDNHIAHTPLKGIIINSLYPVYGSREFSDNDILFDDSYSKLIKKYFKKSGYKVIAYKKSNHDVYEKEPVYNFEMHRALFGDTAPLAFKKYYTIPNIKKKLVNVNSSLYEFNHNDFYIYFMAHLMKHKRNAGIGLRFYTDTYILLNSYKDLDKNYIDSEFDRLGIKEEAHKIEELSLKIFDPSFDFGSLTIEEENILDEACATSTYGDMYKYTLNAMEKMNNGVINKRIKRKYIMSRLFPPASFFKSSHPFIYKTVVFLPVLYILRLFRALFKRKKNVLNELSIINKMDEKA